MVDSVEIAVLGSGVAGAAIAYELRQRNHEVALPYRADDEGSSFTNQKWQHSGLLYPNGEVAAKAWREYQATEDLLRRSVVPSVERAQFLALN